MKQKIFGLMVVFVMGLVGTLHADEPTALQRLGDKDSPLMIGERLVFLGDSITEAGNNPGGYVDLIRKSIARRPDLQADVMGAGIGGNKVPNLQTRLQRDVIDQHPTVVFVYIGINDVWHNPGGTPIERYEEGLRDILQRLQGNGITAILATPSVIGERWDGHNAHDAKLDAYAEVSRKVARDFDVQICDLRAAFISYLREHNPDNAGQGFLTLDTVHLSKAGNELVAEQASSAIIQALLHRAATINLRARSFIDQTAVTILIRDPSDTRVFYTTDGSEPTDSSTAYTKPFTIDQTTRIRAIGISSDGRHSTVDGVYEKVTPLAPTQAPSLSPGLIARVVEKDFSQLPDFDKQADVQIGIQPTPTLLTGHGQQYAVQYTGFLRVPHPAVYQFTLYSDDGSRMTVAGKRVVNNDGMHGPQYATGHIALLPGDYPINLSYFNGGGGAVLQVLWARDGDVPATIPAEAFGHDPQSVPPVPATQPH